MHTEIVLAGFGGQGVLLIGKLLAYAGMQVGQEVTWMPAYGPEMRGGTCNCTVVLSDRPIGSPISKSPHGLIALNLPSLDKFESAVRPGGVIVVNTSLINRLPGRRDVAVVAVPANEIAIECGSAKAANMVALGAYLGASGAADLERVKAIVAESFAAKPKLVEVNHQALSRGFLLGQEQRAAAAAR
jgi:2-oxoglutarate ferredoxin oxidoreductase subunit gamma